MKWFTEGDEETQIKYIGEVKDGVPHGPGAEFFPMMHSTSILM